ncbi:succinate dehydrogenase flavoprotein subunit [Trypanosoma theileri]|uniref:Succinate dehydrogenase flavoprotein subunit n=1 Tax=Trypanosoma theileri TaxID=67003 RepID=A0A1X0P156_9TRYP|nr:succinate dehydrogenase flavoprotein subunit [Trypanosoma theileri]ORC90150.1 succinate dehydrogenase flavoprotein subunit [Trypanosoma theileri]
MFRVGSICRAALASHRPVLSASISTRGVVKRILGDRSNRVPNVSAMDSVITKTKGQGLPGLASLVGRAAFFVKCKNAEAAIAEIDKVLPQIQDEDLKRLALGVRLRARNDLLDLKEAALRVEGGSTELEVSTIRSALREDYKALKSASPGCWLVEMAVAEYCLYEGKLEEAYDAFRDVEGKIGKFIESLKKTTSFSEVASLENTDPSLLLAFHLNRMHDTEGVKVSASKIVDEAIKSIMNDESVKISLEAFKKELGMNLTDEEAYELAYIMEAAKIRHHFHDYFPLDGEYNDWNSESASKAKEKIIHAYAPQSALLEDKILEKVKNSVPPQPFYAPEDQLRKFLSSTTGSKNYLAELKATFGSGPESVLAKSDESYFDAMKTLENAQVSANVAGSSLYPLEQREICQKLARQLLYRTQVNIAVVLTQLDRLQEAIQILDKVINEDEYIYMWRAYLARGEANKRLGVISKADKDFRQLSKLKKSICHNA